LSVPGECCQEPHCRSGNTMGRSLQRTASLP
jgi:hypothetical protein